MQESKKCAQVPPFQNCFPVIALQGRNFSSAAQVFAQSYFNFIISSIEPFTNNQTLRNHFNRPIKAIHVAPKLLYKWKDLIIISNCIQVFTANHFTF